MMRLDSCRAGNDSLEPDAFKQSRPPSGAEASGGIEGERWHVFATAEGHALVVTLEPGKRVKRRIPKVQSGIALNTPSLRAAFARDTASRIAFEARLAAGGSADARPSDVLGKLTFREVGSLWTSGDLAKRFPDHCPPKASVDADRSRLRILSLAIGGVDVRTFSLDDAERAMASIPEGCRTASTRRQYAQLMRRVLQIAVYPLRLRAENPIPKTFVPRSRKSTAIQWLYPSEEAQLVACEAVPLARRLLWGVLAREGMRDGSEATSVTWGCLDLERGTLRLDKNKTEHPRTWKLDPSVTRSLIEWRTVRYGDSEPPANALVFVDENGAPWDGTRFAEVFREDLRRAGVKRIELFEKVPGVRTPIRCHDLRSSFVTVKLAIGWTEAMISARTGHTSSQMISRYRRVAKTAEELEVGDFEPLDFLLFGAARVAPRPSRVESAPATGQGLQQLRETAALALGFLAADDAESARKLLAAFLRDNPVDG